MTTGPSMVDPVDAVELRIERRREQLLRDWDDARVYVARKNRWTPLAAVAGAAALGFGLSRVAPASTPPRQRNAAARHSALAAFAAMLGGGLRFALSPAGRALWTSLRGSRRGRWTAEHR